MSGPQVYTAEFHSGLRARLTVSVEAVECEWTPDLPRNHLKAGERAAAIEAYRAWRDECLRDYARAHQLSLRTIRTPEGFDVLAFSRKESTT